jgi:hypothetical protein
MCVRAIGNAVHHSDFLCTSHVLCNAAKRRSPSNDRDTAALITIIDQPSPYIWPTRRRTGGSRPLHPARQRTLRRARYRLQSRRLEVTTPWMLPHRRGAEPRTCAVDSALRALQRSAWATCGSTQPISRRRVRIHACSQRGDLASARKDAASPTVSLCPRP